VEIVSIIATYNIPFKTYIYLPAKNPPDIFEVERSNHPTTTGCNYLLLDPPTPLPCHPEWGIRTAPCTTSKVRGSFPNHCLNPMSTSNPCSSKAFQVIDFPF